MAEPTSVLTFGDLVLEVAIAAGMAYYGVDGDEAPQVPTNAHDLAECKRHANNAIRMFINDAPPSGWRWTRPVASLILWPSIGVGSGITVDTVVDVPSGTSTVTADAAAFYPSMVGHSITITGFDTYVISEYVSDTEIVVIGDTLSAMGATFSITADGNYRLADTFGGEFDGDITYAASTNQAIGIEWANELQIRRLRENETIATGWPTLAAVSKEETVRRWMLMVYPIPSELLTVEFPYALHFNTLIDVDDTLPMPFTHDETVRAACRAVVERDVDDSPGPQWSYYTNTCLPNSQSKDARSAPRKLGYFGNPQRFVSGNPRDYWRRPNVNYNTNTP